MCDFNQFYKEVDTSSREEMISFLKNHFRYNTMNTWNRLTSYTNNIKIYNLHVTSDVKDALYDMLSVEDTGAYEFEEANAILRDFAENYDGCYHIGRNGRSNGYLVLYTGYKKESRYKSFCMDCGQQNYRPATKDDRRCGRCGKNTRINFSEPHYEYYVNSAGIDMDDDFDDWTDEELKDRVNIVQDFDKTCDAYIQKMIEIAKEYRVEETTVYVPVQKNILVPRHHES